MRCYYYHTSNRKHCHNQKVKHVLIHYAGNNSENLNLSTRQQILTKLFQKQWPRGVLQKKGFLKISQNSQENTCSRISFVLKNFTNFTGKTGRSVLSFTAEILNGIRQFLCSAFGLRVIKKETLAQVFSSQFCKTC